MEIISLIKSVIQNFDSSTPAGSASIVMSSSAGRVVLPVVPAGLPELTNPQNNETFASVMGDINVIGTLGLREVNLESILPETPGKYSWANPMGDNAVTVINFIRRTQSNYEPMRITITYSNGARYLNMLSTIDGFDYSIDNQRDYHYKLHLREYRKVSNNGRLTS